MPIARIIVPAFGTLQDEIAIMAAVNAGRRFNSHVEFLAVHPYPSDAIPNVGVPLTTETMQSIVDGQLEHARTIDDHMRALLIDACSRESAAYVTASPSHRSAVTCTFRTTRGDFDKRVLKAAALSDLTVFGPLHGPAHATFLAVLKESGKPVLVAKAGQSSRMRRIVIGWDGSASAARAIRQSVPFLRCVEQVSVISVNTGGVAPPVDRLSAYLDRQQVPFRCHTICSERGTTIEALLGEAIAMSADLVVAGGYGHDQLWEALFGGATMSLLANPTIPLLLSH